MRSNWSLKVRPALTSLSSVSGCSVAAVGVGSAEDGVDGEEEDDGGGDDDGYNVDDDGGGGVAPANVGFPDLPERLSDNNTGLTAISIPS